MNLQYIKNTEPPPAQSVLQYSVSPDTVFVSTATEQMYANLTITVFNPQSTAVTCQMFHFGFYVGAQYGDLTAQTTGIQTLSGQTSLGISTEAAEDPDTPTLYYYAAPPSGMAALALEPNQSLTFYINGILINEAVGKGGAQFVITEATGTDTNNLSVVKGEITITKEQPTLSAQLSVVPPTPVNPGDSIEVSWVLTDSDHWQLYDTNTGALLYDSEKSSPPNADSYKDSPNQTTIYELIAWDGQLFTSQQATAMVSAPTLSVSPPSVTVDALTNVTIDWTANYAQTVTINPPPASGPATVDATKGQGSFVVHAGETTTYTLYATGDNKTESPPQYVIVNINPVQLGPFTAAPTLQGAKFSWTVESATQIELDDNNGVVKTFAPTVSEYEGDVGEAKTFTLKAYGQDGPAIKTLTLSPLLALSGSGSATCGPFTNAPFNQFTVEMWFQPTTADSETGQTLLSSNLMSETESFSFGWISDYSNKGSIQVGFNAQSSGGDPVTVTITEQIAPPNTWILVALACDGTNTYFYYGQKDGPLNVIPSPNAVLTFDNAVPLIIGYAKEGFVGYVQGVRLWNVWRSAEEVQSASCNLQPPQPGLIAYFDFSQLPFNDTSGNNLSIQLSGDAAPVFQPGPCESPSETVE